MRKLEIGAKTKRKGWEVLDIIPGEHVDIVADISKTLPIEEDTYDSIYLSHVLEHIEWYKTLKTLRELYRILKVGGRIEIHVPDIDKIIKAYQEKTIPDGWFKYNRGGNPFLWFAGRLFTYGSQSSDFHKAVFNKEYLRECLERVGFENIKEVSEKGGVHGYINLGMKADK